METYTSQTLPEDFTGRCIYITSKGKYIGDFINGNMTGLGEFVYKDGSKHVGNWIYGLFVSGIRVRPDGFKQWATGEGDQLTLSRPF